MDMIRNLDNREQAKELLSMALYLGEILLKNGAETYRVEDSVRRVCLSFQNVETANVFVIQSLMLASIEIGDEKFVDLKRVKGASINLRRIHLANRFSREFVNGEVPIKQGFQQLKEIENLEDEHSPITLIALSSIIGPAFCAMFNGSGIDFISAYIATFAVIYALKKFDKLKFSFFFQNFAAAFIATILSLALYKLGMTNNLDSVIIGAIMPIVPGVAITNAVRDTMSGEFVAGTSKLMEAIFCAFAIAIGVGAVLTMHIKGMI